MRRFLVLVSVLSALAAPVRAAEKLSPEAVLDTWYRLVLELVRHTPTYTPPVASRTFAYLGVTAWESTVPFTPGAVTLGGQLNDFTPAAQSLPPDADQAVVLNAALQAVVEALFANTGPTGQRALASVGAKLEAGAAAGLDAGAAAASAALGRDLAAAILAWAAEDGGAIITNMGFPEVWDPGPAPESWVPTSLIVQQQAPLLPGWGNLRPFAMPDGAACPVAAPPAWGEDVTSPLGAEAAEVLEVKAGLSEDERAIARFWSDDPMLSPTPPGHWISIGLQIIRRDGLDAARAADVLARTGIAVGDAFIGCWHEKYRWNLLRPVTWIRRYLDKGWEPLLTTPPFPEYPSGHSVQSAAAALVLTRVFGEDFAFEDTTPVADGLPARRFASFAEAAEEAALSRLYGGIHYRSAIDQGLVQGRCIGAFAAALRTLP